MKKLLLFIVICLPALGFSQADSVSIDAGYTHQAFYSFSNGLVKKSTSDWDLAFGIGGFNVDIRTNEGHKVKLYLYPNGDTAAWNNIDTTGLHNWMPRHNDENNWSNTAFTTGGNHPDYGWGVYNSTTHDVVGDSIYILQTKAGDFKKLRIDGMYAMTAEFKFTYADLDGSNEMTGTVKKTDYTGKNFAYYSIDNNNVLDLEPMAADWDIVFSKYGAVQPQGGYYNVTGVQTNKNRTSAEARGVNINTVDWNTQNFVSEVGTIGWDWKSFNMTTFSYDIEDSLTYFVADTNNNVWQITMTAFDYTVGKFVFNKKRVSGVSVEDITNGFNEVKLFPNPATENVTLNIISEHVANDIDVNIYSLTGQLVWSRKVDIVSQTNIEIPVHNWQKGIYIVRIGSSKMIQQLVVQ